MKAGDTVRYFGTQFRDRQGHTAIIIKVEDSQRCESERLYGIIFPDDTLSHICRGFYLKPYSFIIYYNETSRNI
jgi:hypothetical protein